MLSSEALERLIAVKRREIETEKILLGLAPQIADKNGTEPEDKENTSKPPKQVQFSTAGVLSERNDAKEECSRNKLQSEPKRDFEEIPPDLERYIRRYLGLPVMLKAGEYSPNNPLIRSERPTGDALLGLGEYERRRNTLRKIRQRQYREHLDQQAKIKQEAKEKAERERKEREERERLEEERERERERERELERERYSPVRRGSANYSQVSGANNAYSVKVDSAVQVSNVSKPLSVAVQTDEEDLFRLTPTPKNLLTQAERELSPRTVVDPKDDRPIQPASWAIREQWKDGERDWKDSNTDWKDPSTDWKESAKEWKDLRRLEDKDWKGSERDWMERNQERRRSYGDFDERARRASLKPCTELRTYKPSILDADAIEMRNLHAEKEAAARKQFYQQELKNQILEQQRIREERQAREKMLEQAEMRRLEQQLRSLRTAQDIENDRRHHIDTQIKDDETEYDRKRIALQKEIDSEQQSLLHASHNVRRTTHTSKSETYPSKLPFYYPKTHENLIKPQENKQIERPTYSTNIPDNSVFSPNYDVESYLRRNLNPTRESLNSNRLPETYSKNEPTQYIQSDDNRNVIVERALVHDRPKAAERKLDRPKFTDHGTERNYDRSQGNDRGSERNYDRSQVKDRGPERNFDRSQVNDRFEVNDRPKGNDRPGYDPFEVQKGKEDPLPIPVLRHSPKPRTLSEHKSDLSQAMQVIEDKWKIPVVQKNILKSLPNEDGKSVSILTQLGSIRRQLQLEQLKLDKMLCKDSDV